MKELEEKVQYIEERLNTCATKLESKMLKFANNSVEIMEFREQLDEFTTYMATLDLKGKEIDSLKISIDTLYKELKQHMDDEELSYKELEKKINRLFDLSDEHKESFQEIKDNFNEVNKRLDQGSTYFKIGAWVLGSFMAGIASMLFKLLWEGIK